MNPLPYAEINGAKIYFEIEGSGKPLLLMHGVRGSIRNWQYVRPHIVKHFRTIFCDLRGHGRSSELTEVIKMNLFARDQIALLEYLEVDSCLVAGHSFGGFIAQYMALDAPERVKALILIATAPTVDVDAALAQIELGQLAYNPDSEDAIEKILDIAFYNPKRIRKTPGMRDLLLFDHKEGMRLAMSHGYAQGAAAGFNLLERVKEISHPTLVIIGAQDETFPLKWGHFYKEHMSKATIQIIDKSNHAIPLEQPEALVKAIVHFVKSLEKG